MTPECDYTARMPNSISHLGDFDGATRGPWEGGATGWISDVARWAIRKNRNAFEGMCRLKSTKPCTRKPAQATSPESCKAPAKELLSWRNRLKDSLSKTPRNQAQQSPPRMPVSARASR